MSTPQKPDDTRNTIRIPFSLIIPVWTIVASLAGVWYSQEQAQTQARIDIASVQKDVNLLKRSVTEVSQKLGVYNDVAYTVGDAANDRQQIDAELADHEKRLRDLEKHRK